MQLALIIWVVFLGDRYVLVCGNHAAIGVIVEMSPEKFQKLLNVLITAAAVITLCYVGYQGVQYITQMARYDRVASILKIPYSPIYTPLPIGCLATAVQVYLNAYRDLTGKGEGVQTMEISIILISAVVLLVLLFPKVPMFVSVLSDSIAYFFLTGGLFIKTLGQRVLADVESIPLLAIPFFICTGVFMNYSGVTRRVMGFCNAMTGCMTEGLAQVDTLLSALVGGLLRSNLADTAMEAKMLALEMECHGYSKQFSTMVTTMLFMIMPLISPGIAMILYSSIADISVGKLLIASIGPGLLLYIAMMMLVYFISKKGGYMPMRTERLIMKQAAPEIASTILPLCLPVIIIGDIHLEIFTPAEAGAVTTVCSLVLGVVYKELKLKDIGTSLKETVATTAPIMLIVDGASTSAWILTRKQIPRQFTALVLGTIHDKYLFFFVIILFLIVVGTFIKGNAVLIVLVPLLAPVTEAYDIDPIHFAMVYIFTMAYGGATPPMGTLIFVTCGIIKCKVKEPIRESIPFYVVLLVCMMLMAYVLVFSTGPVNLFY